MFRRYCIQNVKDGIQIQECNVNNESVNHFSQFISVKVKTNLRKCQTQFQKKLRKLRLRENHGFLIKKRVVSFPKSPSSSFYNFARFHFRSRPALE